MKDGLKKLMAHLARRGPRGREGNPLLLYQERAQNAVRNFSRRYTFENRLRPAK